MKGEDGSVCNVVVGSCRTWLSFISFAMGGIVSCPAGVVVISMVVGIAREGCTQVWLPRDCSVGSMRILRRLALRLNASGGVDVSVLVYGGIVGCGGWGDTPSASKVTMVGSEMGKICT